MNKQVCSIVEGFFSNIQNPKSQPILKYSPYTPEVVEWLESPGSEPPTREVRKQMTNFVLVPENEERFTVKSTKALYNIIIKFRKRFPKYNDYNWIDTSKITDMACLFLGMRTFNGDVTKWDVSNVTNMKSTFSLCKQFNQDISGWDMSNVKIMDWMLSGCEKFKQDISRWNLVNCASWFMCLNGCGVWDHPEWRPTFMKPKYRK